MNILAIYNQKYLETYFKFLLQNGLVMMTETSCFLSAQKHLH